jgi:ornithine cyclodeaminase/alanine dehydrogenase-like protein (mu-crystallin family)
MLLEATCVTIHAFTEAFECALFFRVLKEVCSQLRSASDWEVLLSESEVVTTTTATPASL